jgi:uncharacterized membrane protein YeaQ/YmgE (transglycosylase-associated protein family)
MLHIQYQGGKNMGVIWTIVLGFVIGLIAKLIHPGKENMGLIMTIMIGIAGSFLAGIIGQFLGWYKAGEGAGFIASVIVAIVLLVIYGKIKDKTSS